MEEETIEEEKAKAMKAAKKEEEHAEMTMANAKKALLKTHMDQDVVVGGTGLVEPDSASSDDDETTEAQSSGSA